MKKGEAREKGGRYKRMEIILRESLSEKEEAVIRELNEAFPGEDIFFEIDGLKITVAVRELDLNLFEHEIKRLLKANQLTGGNIIQKILDKIKGIKSYGLRGNKRVYMDYNKERKVKDREAKEETRGIHYYARGHGFSTQNNELPSEYTNQVICGDSAEVLRKLPDNCIDLVFTSPPYNFGLDYDSNKDGVDWNSYFEKLFEVLKECIRVVKYGGRIIINVQPLFSDYIPIHHIVSDFFMKNKLIWKGEILWEKHNYNCKYTAWGSWKSPSNPYLKYTWEFLEIFCKGNLKHDGRSEKADITGDEFKKWVYAKWNIAPERSMKEFDHPAMFPEKLVEQVLKLFSFENDVVLDPFNGVGTTTKVAKQFNRRFLGIDISEEYTKKAKKRLKTKAHE